MQSSTDTKLALTEEVPSGTKHLLVNTRRRVWRTPRTRPAKARVWKAKVQRKRTWSDKEADRERLRSIRELERSLKQQLREQQAAERERRARVQAQREANALRTGAQLQVIRDVSKVKRMSKRQQKLLRKMAL
jgi:hypothetical protein